MFVFILFSTLLDKVYAEEGETGGGWGRLGEDWGKNAIKWWEDSDHSDHPEQIVSMAARPGSSVVLRRMMRCEKRQGDRGGIFSSDTANIMIDNQGEPVKI